MSGVDLYKPSPRQRLVIRCPYEEILYGGAAGAGKSFLLILDWLAHWHKYGKHSSGILFRNTNGELLDMRQKMDEVFSGMGAKWRDREDSFVFKDGARLRLSYLDSYDDALKQKGFEFTWKAHDELTQRPTDQEYIYLASRMRSPHGVPTRCLACSNPDGPGHLWVKKRWKIDKYPNGMHEIHTYYECDNEGKPLRMLDEEEGAVYDRLQRSELPSNIRRTTRIFIPGRLSDNEYLERDGNYRAHLLALPEAQRKMLLDGRWDITEGAFFDEWNPAVHVVKSFKPPADWKRWMAGDWGTNKPYCFGWICESPQGDRYLYRELVGCKNGDYTKDQGTRESPLTVAERINQIEREADEFITERWLDASCFDNYEHGLSVAEQFSSRGLPFQKAQKKFKSGSIGILRDHLKITNDTCRFKVMDCCQYITVTIPLLMVDKHNVEQYDSDGPDHGADMLCYILRRNIRSKEEIARERGVSTYNARLKAKYGRYGAH